MQNIESLNEVIVNTKRLIETCYTDENTRLCMMSSFIDRLIPHFTTQTRTQYNQLRELIKKFNMNVIRDPHAETWIFFLDALVRNKSTELIKYSIEYGDFNNEIISNYKLPVIL